MQVGAVWVYDLRTNAIRKHVVIQSQHVRAYLARSDRLFIIRINSETWGLWVWSSNEEELGSLR